MHTEMQALRAALSESTLALENSVAKRRELEEQLKKKEEQLRELEEQLRELQVLALLVYGALSA